MKMEEARSSETLVSNNHTSQRNAENHDLYGTRSLKISTSLKIVQICHEDCCAPPAV
jgi:hypothetical protein